MKQFRIQLLIAFVVFLCGSALIGAIYILSTKDVSMAKPGQVVSVSRPSPVAKPSLPNRLIIRSNLMRHAHSTHVACQSSHSSVTSTSMPSVHTKGLHTTSSAQVTTVGGGGSPSMPFTISHSSSRQVLNRQVAVPTTNFLAIASTRTMSAPGASEAPQMASIAPHKAPAPPTVNDLLEDDQLVEHPVPVGTAELFIVLAFLYTLFVAVRKRGLNAAQ